MGRFSITRRPSDILYSKYLRKLRNYICEKCGAKHEPNSKNLGVSHFWGRAKESVRHDEENCEILCNWPCHEYFETHRTEYEHWKEQRMGTKAYNLLKFRAHQLGKRDDKLIVMFYKQKLKELSTPL